MEHLSRRLLAILLCLSLAGCTGGETDGDSDGDSVDDANETAGRVIEIQKLDGIERRAVTSDTDKKDTDRDGLSDADELLVRMTDPRDPDTDDDGLLDGDDVVPADEALAGSWRSMGILEVNGTFLGELDACAEGGYQLKANVASSDLPLPDQLLDGEELRGWEVVLGNGTRTVTSDPCIPDTDGDGLQDDGEKLAGSDPRDLDTDADGVRDGADADPTADLYLSFRELNVSGTNATTVRVEFSASTTATLVWPGTLNASLNVPDNRGIGDSALVSVVLSVKDEEGQPLALTADPRGAILEFDLLQRTVAGVEPDGDTLRFSGDDGSMSFRWSVERR